MSIRSVERGGWEFVCRGSTARNSKPGVMKMSAGKRRSRPGSRPSGRRTAVSSVRATVVPTAMTRRLSSRARAISRRVAEGMEAAPEPEAHQRNAPFPDLRKKPLGEVEARGRRGDGERLLCEHGLVALAVLGPVGRSGLAADGGRERDAAHPPEQRCDHGLLALAVCGPVGRSGLAADVGRKRNAPDPLEQFRVHVPAEQDLAPAILTDLLDAALEVFGEPNGPVSFCPPSRPGERLPEPKPVSERAQEKDLHETALFVAAVEPRHPHSDIVAYEDVPLPQQARKIGETAMRDGSRVAVEHEKP